jgi:hypothetical protein
VSATNSATTGITALVIETDRTSRIDALAKGDWDELREVIGGWLTRVQGRYMGKPWAAFCDEEGRPKGQRYNAAATELAKAVGWRAGADYLVGRVVFVGIKGDVNLDVPGSVLTLARGMDILAEAQP